MEIEMSGPDMTEDEINELARELAEITLTEDIEAEFEAYMDAAWAEHEMQMYAANSYDNDAIAYGEF
jgi:DNA-binding transcriptional regulator/RsmH inhibitor MraZ